MNRKFVAVALAFGFVNCCMAQRSEKNKLVDELLAITDTATLQKRLQVLKASDKEEEVSAVVLYYYNRKKDKEAEAFIPEVRQRFPNGAYAYAAAHNAVIKTEGGANKERLLKEMMPRFQSNRNLMMPVYSVAYAYALEGDTVKSAQYVQMIRISHDLPGRLCNLSKAAVTGNQTVYAEHLMERCITLFDSLRNIPDPGGDPLGMARNIKRYGSMFYTQYASILTKNGKIAKAAEYSGKAYENNTEDGEAAGNYAGLLVKGKQYAAALPILEKLVGKGLSNDEVKDILREAYTALNGGKGYDAYIAGLTKNLKQAAIDSARKNIISEPAPMFTLSDVDGKNWSLAELKGKVVVLDFWATWCAPCKKSFPAMQMAVNKYSRDPNVVFLFIHTWERGDNAAVDAKKYVTDNKFNFNVLMDVRNGGQNKVVSSFKAKGIPAKFVIDGNGNIRFKMTGFAGGNDAAVEELSAMIDLAKKS